MRASEARRIASQARRIAGWLSPDAAALFALVDEVQRGGGVTGGLFEIGVHHGRSAVLLCAMAGPHERVGACDLFGQQNLNLSGSGAGDREIFERNIAEFAPGFDRLSVHEKSSASLTATEIGAPQRLFHVDGGHAVEEALDDIRLGAQVLHERGAIVVDDPFRMEWPGVTEAILAFLDEQPEFTALVVGFNKLVLVREAARSAYEHALLSPWGYFDARVYAVKTLPLRGRPTTIFYVPSYRQLARLDSLVARARSLKASAGRQLTKQR